MAPTGGISGQSLQDPQGLRRHATPSLHQPSAAVVTDSGDISADQSLSVHAAVLALSGGADMDYDPGFERRLKAAGVSLDSEFYPGAPAEVTMDPTAGPAAGRRVVDFLDHQFR